MWLRLEHRVPRQPPQWRDPRGTRIPTVLGSTLQAPIFWIGSLLPTTRRRGVQNYHKLPPSISTAHVAYLSYLPLYILMPAFSERNIIRARRIMTTTLLAKAEKHPEPSWGVKPSEPMGVLQCGSFRGILRARTRSAHLCPNRYK